MFFFKYLCIPKPSTKQIVEDSRDLGESDCHAAFFVVLKKCF